MEISPSSLPFGEWVRTHRKGMDITQKHLANQVGISYSTIRKIESGERRPSLQVAALLAKHLEIEPGQVAAFLQMAREGQEQGSDFERVQEDCQGNSKFPYAPVPLIGRGRVLAAIEKLLQDPACRLVSVVGQGGVGKTRLALEIARLEERKLPCNVVFIGLEEAEGPADALKRIGSAISEENSLPATGLDPLFEIARHNPLLLILDGVEHLGEEFARLVADMIHHGPQVKVLATSRQPLRLHGEWVYRLHGLSLQAASGERVSDAAQMFIECARRNLPNLIPGEEDLPEIERICQRIGGLPLGIELAAVWVPALSIAEIGQEIQKDIDFLVMEAPDLPERHRSLRNVFIDTWKMLSEKEQREITALSKFYDPFTRQMAKEKAWVELDALSALVSKSLLEYSSAEYYAVNWLARRYLSATG